MSMAIAAAASPAYLALVLLPSLFILTSFGDDTQINYSNSNNDYLMSEIQKMKHRIAQLELLLEVTDLEVYTKGSYIEKCEKKIEEMSQTIHHLESVLSNLKGAPDDDEEKLNSLELEVRELEVGVRKNELELRLLTAKAKDDENWVALLASQVETMANIVSELWFHVQKLEQALEVIERRTAELRKHIRNQRCYFFKFINNIIDEQHQKMVSAYTSEALNQLRRLFSAVKKYHHQLQGFVKQEMERIELTAVLADAKELIFFLASAIIVFPLIVALIWLSSHWI